MLLHTGKVKSLVQTCLRNAAGWEDTGEGWEAMESTLKLAGWSRSRRVILVREAPAKAPVGAQARRRRDHLSLPGASGVGWESGTAPWSGRIAVLVTSLDPETRQPRPDPSPLPPFTASIHSRR
ncbi:MAG: hypothetical protein ACKV19_10820, partial [Verrucomicrobiales bacterium]